MDSHRDAAADVLVIFGITGDLARRMTFRALYRLERRRLRACGRGGVTGTGWGLASEHYVIL